MNGPSPAGVYLIAEAGSNHDGDLDLALRLVDAAAAAGADAVKFQLFRAAELYPEACGVVETPIGEVDFFDLLRDLELPAEWLDVLQQRAQEAGVELLCTPFDVGAVATLDRMGVSRLKIASPELTDHELLVATAATGRPVILSTGMSTLGDVEESLSVLTTAGAVDVTLLQCTTAYPTPPEDLRLGAIPVLADAFGVPVGLSDHSTDPEVAPAVAVALGGSVIEKHFTLSRQDGSGPDHPFAIEPDELERMVAAVRWMDSVDPSDRLAEAERRFGAEQVAAVIGPRSKTISPAERELASCDRRSVHALRTLESGERLDRTNIRVLRGERNLRPGLHPRHLPDVLGAELQRRVESGDGIVWADLLS